MGQCCSSGQDGLRAKSTTAQRIARVTKPVVPGPLGVGGPAADSKAPLSPTLLGGGLTVNLFDSRHDAPPASTNTGVGGRLSTATSSKSRRSLKAAGFATVFVERISAAANASRKSSLAAAAAAAAASASGDASSGGHKPGAQGCRAAAPEPLDLALPVREVSCFVDTPLSPDSDFASWRSVVRREQGDEDEEEEERERHAAAVARARDAERCQRHQQRRGAETGEASYSCGAADDTCCSVTTTPCESFCASDAAPSPVEAAADAAAGLQAPWAESEGGGDGGDGLPKGYCSRLAVSSKGGARGSAGSSRRSTADADDEREEEEEDDHGAHSCQQHQNRRRKSDRDGNLLAARGARSSSLLLRQATANRLKAAAAAAAAAAGGHVAPAGVGPSRLSNVASGKWVLPQPHDGDGDSGAHCSGGDTDHDGGDGGSGTDREAPQPQVPNTGRRELLYSGSRRLSLERPQLSEAGTGTAEELQGDGNGTDGASSADGTGRPASSGSGATSARSRASSALMRLRREAAARNAVVPEKTRLDYVPQPSRAAVATPPVGTATRRRLLPGGDSCRSAGGSARASPLRSCDGTTKSLVPERRDSCAASVVDERSEGGYRIGISDYDGSDTDADCSDFAPLGTERWPPAPPPSVVQLHYYLINEGAKRAARRQRDALHAADAAASDAEGREEEKGGGGAATSRRAGAFLRNKAISERVMMPARWAVGNGVSGGAGGRPARAGSHVRWQADEEAEAAGAQPQPQPPHHRAPAAAGAAAAGAPSQRQQQAPAPRQPAQPPQPRVQPQPPPQAQQLPPQPPTPPLKAPSPSICSAQSAPLPPRPPRREGSPSLGLQARAFFQSVAELKAARRARRDSLADMRLQPAAATDTDASEGEPWDGHHHAGARQPTAPAHRATVSGEGSAADAAAAGGRGRRQEQHSPLWLYRQPPPSSRADESRATASAAPIPQRKKSFSHSGGHTAGHSASRRFGGNSAPGEQYISDALCGPPPEPLPSRPPAMRPRLETEYGDDARDGAGSFDPRARDPRARASPAPTAPAPPAPAPSPTSPAPHVKDWVAAAAAATGAGQVTASPAGPPVTASRHGRSQEVPTAPPARSGWRASVAAVVAAYETGTGSGGGCGGVSGGAGAELLVPLPTLPPGSVGPYTPSEAAKGVALQPPPWEVVVPERSPRRGPETPDQPAARGDAAAAAGAAPARSDCSGSEGGEYPASGAARTAPGQHARLQPHPGPRARVGSVGQLLGGTARAGGWAAGDPERLASDASTVFTNELYEEEEQGEEGGGEDCGDGAVVVSGSRMAGTVACAARVALARQVGRAPRGQGE